MAAPQFPSLTKTYHNDTYPSITPTLPSLSLRGKTVLITGGGSGIGAATALAFATAGAKVAILGRTISTLNRTKKTILSALPEATVLTFAADISSAVDVEAAFSATHTALGKIDIFVSNAGVLLETKPMANMGLETFLKVFEINTKGPFICLQAFPRYAAEGAVVINVSSAVASLPAMPTMVAYGASKLATVKVFDTFQAENPGFRVLNLQPAVAKTEIQHKEREPGAVDDMIWLTDTVDLPAHFMVWLASDEAKFLKGKFVWANWDVDELKSRAGEIENSALLTMNLEGWPFTES